MDQDLGKSIFKISEKNQGYDLTRAVLKTNYPLAVWRLPFHNITYILFDLTQSREEKPIEDLHQSFVINRYGDCHPPKPLVLSGDIILQIEGDRCEVCLNPALSGDRIEGFCKGLETPVDQPKNRKPVELQMNDDFEEKVVTTIEQIKGGLAQKIVLSRFEEHDISDDLDVLELFEKLMINYPGAFCHLTSTEHGVWLGASPERLISIDERRYFQTDALAGTQPLMPESLLSEVAWTQKEIEEQAMVSRYIINCLKKIRLREFEEIGPKTVKAGNLAHLKTEFKIDMELTNSPTLGSTMLDLLHPTSAVCGYPRDAANDFIAKTEGYDRELYAGFLGPVGFEGNSKLYVNLRCMKIRKGKARLYAGAGITEDSNPHKEYEETVYKLQTLLSVLKK